MIKVETITVEKAKKYLIADGFKECSFPQIPSQEVMFQLVDDRSNLIVNLSFQGWVIISDGRATVNRLYYTGPLTTMLPYLLDHCYHNLIEQKSS